MAFPAALPEALGATLQAAASEGMRQSWRLLNLPPAWVVVFVLLPAAGLVAWAAYLKENLGRTARMSLIGMRLTSLILLMLVLCRPVKVKHQENVLPAEAFVLVDDSASMRRKDAYAGDAALRSALARLRDAPPDASTRLELARAGLERELLPTLRARGYQVRLFGFAESLLPVSDLEALQGRGNATHLGDALGRALAGQSGRHVTDVVVVSDGRSNGGTPALDAAAAAARQGIPVHTVVVGDTRPERNVLVELVEAPGSVLEGDEVTISVRVSGRGASPEERTLVVLEELSGDSGGDVRMVAEEEIGLVPAGERVVLVAPAAEGGMRTERRFRVSVPPQPEETLVDDNQVELSVHVTREKIRVLYVDGYPRYEYRFLKDLLKRADERIEVQCYLMSATPGFPQEATRGMDSLASVPTGRKELLDSYDVILLGDVNPYQISPDPARGEEFVQSLFEFVERGGGLCFIAGEFDDPRALAGTDVAELLPVLLDTSGTLLFEQDTTVETQPVLEDAANPHEIVRLHTDLELNHKLWEDAGGLRGFYWFYPVLKAKPGSQVLLRHPRYENNHGRFPLLVTGYYPSGRTMFVAVDSTYRWRYRYMTRYHERFWRNAVRWLALGRLRSGDRRYQLEPLRSAYNLDERVTLEARVLDEDFQPSLAGQQDVTLESPEGQTTPLPLHLVEGRSGLYRGTFDAGRPGLYRAWIEVEGQRAATTEVEIVLPSLENADPSPDPETLAAVAHLTSGRSVGLARLADLSDEFPGGEERREPISSELEDAWDHWGTLLLALALLSAEWILRKRLELI